MTIRSDKNRTVLRSLSVAIAPMMLLAGGPAHAMRDAPATIGAGEARAADLQFAQNARQQPRNPNSGNRNPPNSGNARPGRPQATDRQCSEVRNPRPGRNCTERPDHFRPAQRPPE